MRSKAKATDLDNLSTIGLLAEIVKRLAVYRLDNQMVCSLRLYILIKRNKIKAQPTEFLALSQPPNWCKIKLHSMEVVFMARKKEIPQKAAMREMMRNYMKNNDISIKDGTNINSIMSDVRSVGRIS